MSQAPTQVVINVVLLDGFFQSFMLGAVLAQGFQYWSNHNDDSRRKRLFVATVVLLSFLQTVLEDYKVFRTISFKHRWSTSPIQWTDFLLNGFICSMCQGFYIGRCWLMTEKRRWVLFPFGALLVVTGAANIYLAVVLGIAFSGHSASTNDILNVSRNLLPSTITAFTLWISGTLALDICITTTLIVTLWRSKTGSLQSDQVVHHIIKITWESAALPSICTIVAAALYRAVPNTYDHVVILLVLQTGKLYVLGMLRSLNLRSEFSLKLRSVDLGGRTSLRNWNWDTTTVRGSFPSTEPLKPAAEIGMLSDSIILHHSLDVMEEQLPKDLETHLNDPFPARRENGGTRNRVSSRRSTLDM